MKEKYSRGITLLSLVITIVILLIITIVTIDITKNAGIIEKVQQGKNEYIKVNEVEILENALSEWLLENTTNENAEDEFQSFVSDKLSNYDVEVQNAKKIKFSNQEYLLATFNKTQNKYKLTEKLIEEIDEQENSITEIKVGDYVEYNPSTNGTYDVEFLNKYSGVSGDNNSVIDVNKDGKIDATELMCPTWRILRIYPDGSVDLVGDSTNKSIAFKGTVGYNNCVFLLNDICENLYSNKENNIIARSLNLNDLESYLTKQGIEKRNEYINMVYTTDRDNAVQYATTNTFKGKVNYPTIFGLGKNAGVELDEINAEGIDASDPYYTKENLIAEEGLNKSYLQTKNKLTVEETNYSLSINEENYGEAYDVLKSSGWVATRVTLMETRAAIQFCLASVNSGGFWGKILAYSHLRLSTQSSPLRPVVSIPSSAELIACNGENSKKNPHQIEYNIKK